jgi:hypothetical protein
VRITDRAATPTIAFESDPNDWDQPTILSQLTVILYLIMYLLMFAAAIYLRYSQPNRPRPYRIPGGTAGMWIIGGAGFAGQRNATPSKAALKKDQRGPLFHFKGYL